MFSISRYLCARPLSEHPPVMVNQLVRAITRCPRWFAMQKFVSAQVEEKKQEQLAKRARAKAKRISKRSGSKTKKPPSSTSSKGNDSSNVPQLKRKAEAETENPLVPVGALSDLAQYNVLDCTFGGGSHTEALLEAGEPFLRVFALDCDSGGVQRRAEITAKKYGKSRFRFFPGFRFSQVETLFGSRAFDAVIVDPGPNFSQLNDPTRGFLLDNPHDVSLFDMRYSPRFKNSALDVLNNSEEQELYVSAAEVALLPDRMARHIIRGIVRHRPFHNLEQALAAMQSSSSIGDFSDDNWFEMSRSRFVRVHPVVRFMFALRASVNHEIEELTECLRAAAEALEEDGRLVLFTRLPFEKEIAKNFADTHPFILTSFEMNIPQQEAAEFSQPLETSMHVFQKTKEPCFEIKNMRFLKDQDLLAAERKKNEERHTYALDGLGTRYGFPANLFRSSTKARFKEMRQLERNASPPPVVLDRADYKSKLPRT